MKLVTVVMAVFNGEQWLEEAIQSVISQSFQNFDFIILDDGSSDKSPQILEKYDATYSNITVVTKPNSGLANSLNLGIVSTDSKYIARIDADDVWDVDKLEKQVKFLEDNDDVALLGSGMRTINEHGIFIKEYYFDQKNEKVVHKLLKHGRCFAHSSVLIRRSVLSEVGLYRPVIRKAEDYDLWLRISKVRELACLESVLVSIRLHDNQISHKDSGDRQYLDAVVAKVLYHLEEDNSDFSMEADSIEGISHKIHNYLLENRFYEHRRIANRLRTNLSNASNFIMLWITLLQNFSTTLMLIKARVHGDVDPIKIIKSLSLSHSRSSDAT